MATRRRRGFTPDSERALIARFKRLTPDARKRIRSELRTQANAIRDEARRVVPVANPRRRRYGASGASPWWTDRHIRDAIRVSLRTTRPVARVGLLTKRSRSAHHYARFIEAGVAGRASSRHGPIPFMSLAVERVGPRAAARIREEWVAEIVHSWVRPG